MIFKYGDFREGESRSDVDRTKIAEVWLNNTALTKDEANHVIDNSMFEQLEFDFTKDNK